MPSIATRLRAVAVTAACASAAVTVLATPSSADSIGIVIAPQPIIREIVGIVDVPDLGDVVDPGDIPGCDTSSSTYYCIAKGATVLGPLVVPSVDADSQNVTNVVAYMDVYEVDAGVAGGDLLTCIALTTPVPIDPCGNLGFELKSRTELVEQPVDSYQPRTDSANPITSVTVCRADVTGKAAGREFFAQVLTTC